MKWIKNNLEIIIGYVLGVIFIGIGIFIIWNGKYIVNFKEIEVNKLHMVHIFDFLNIYIYALIKILSHYIHGYPLIVGMFIVLYGLGFLYISRLLKQSTQYDTVISTFYLLSGIFMFIFTGVLMFEIYSFFALLYLLCFLVLVFFVVNRRKLNDTYRKTHYIVLLTIFSIAYVITQSVVYDNLANDSITPLDMMALNFFFILMVTMGVVMLGNYIFLFRSKKVPYEVQELSRLKKNKHDRHINELISTQTNEAFEQLSKQSLKMDEKLMMWYSRAKKKIVDLIDLQDDDIPRWMKRPKWFKFFHVEIVVGILMLILTLIELNNRNVLFNISKFNVVKMQYFYEWINLFALLIVILLYLFFTLRIYFRNRGYFGQLITVTILFVKIITSFYLMLFKGVNLALFIPPVVILLVFMITPLFLYHLKKSY